MTWGGRRKQRRTELAEMALLVNSVMKVEDFLATLPPGAVLPETRAVLEQIREVLQ